MSSDDAAIPASIRIRRRVEWMDTDAAGIYHWSTVIRFAEAAEAELHNALGIAEITFGATPRVRAGFDFRRPLRFNDRATIDFSVQEVGRSSVRYRVVLSDDEERRAPPRADERLQRALERGDAAEREERRHRARAERAEGGAVAVGEENGRHGKGIMGRRP